MIQLRDITLGYGHKSLVTGANVDIRRERLVALVGRNGSGKSTLLRAVAGIDRPKSGSVVIGGKDISAMSRHELACTISFVNTERVRISDMRCRDVVALGRAPYTDWIGRLGDDDRRAVDEALETMGMTGYASRTINTLSDGEMQRIMIARALAQSTPVMLLDEPTSFLDMPGRYEICLVLKRLAHEHGRTIIFSTHELDIAMRICDDILLVDTPSLVYGTAAEVRASDAFRRMFGSIADSLV